MKSHPRGFAALWFGATGLIPVALWFLPAMIKHRAYTGFHMWTFLLFPCLSAALSGYLIGANLLDPDRVKSMGRALLQGVLVAILAIAINAPISAAYGALTRPDGATVSFFGMTAMTLFFGLLATGWAAAIFGAISAGILYKVGQRP